MVRSSPSLGGDAKRGVTPLRDLRVREKGRYLKTKEGMLKTSEIGFLEIDDL